MASIAQGGAIFIGSLPYSSSEEAFTAISHAVGDHIRYLCDGETGERWNFVEFQTQRHPSSLLQAFAGGTEPKALSQERYDEMYEKHETDYDTAAVASYAVFKKLKATGKIPKHVRFQVCVATPVNVMGMIAPQHRPMVEQYYERSLNRALRVIQDSIPHEELVIQRDMSAEFCMVSRVRLRSASLQCVRPWARSASGAHGRHLTTDGLTLCAARRSVRPAVYDFQTLVRRLTGASACWRPGQSHSKC